MRSRSSPRRRSSLICSGLSKPALISKRSSAKILSLPRLIDFLNDRGSEQGIFGELKSENTLAYVPTRIWTGNQTYMLAALLAKNLTREMLMRT